MEKLSRYIDLFLSKYDFRWRHENEAKEYDKMSSAVSKKRSLDDVMNM